MSICKIRNSGCLFKIGVIWPSMSVIVVPGMCLTYTNHFWGSKLPSSAFNMEFPAMQMLPSRHLLYLSGQSLNGRLSCCVTRVT